MYISFLGSKNASSHRLFYISFVLSEAGVKHFNEIVSYVYQYIGMLRHYCSSDEGLPRWIFDEIKSVNDVLYQFDDEPSPEELVEVIAEDLVPVPFMLPPERLLDGSSLYFEFNQNMIKDVLDRFLQPDNARIDIISSLFGKTVDAIECSPEESSALLLSNSSTHRDNVGYAHEFGTLGIESPQTEPMFGTRFWCHKIDPHFIAEWRYLVEPQVPPESSQLSLPPMNPFVPKNFHVKSLPTEDAHHPMLHCSFKVCVTIGKSKVWMIPCIFSCSCNISKQSVG